MSHTRRIESGAIRDFQPERIFRRKRFAEDNQVTTLRRSILDIANHLVESLAPLQPDGAICASPTVTRFCIVFSDQYVVRKSQ